MIDKDLLRQTVEEAIQGTGLFLVDLTVRPANAIVVEVDSAKGVDIDSCAALTRAIEARFDRDVEDFELEVGSAGLTAPFKVRAQYEKNIGNEVEVLTRDGRKFSGILTEVADDAFTVAVTRKVKPEGAKRPVLVEEPERVEYTNARQVKYVINFK